MDLNTEILLKELDEIFANRSLLDINQNFELIIENKSIQITKSIIEASISNVRFINNNQFVLNNHFYHLASSRDILDNETLGIAIITKSVSKNLKPIKIKINNNIFGCVKNIEVIGSYGLKPLVEKIAAEVYKLYTNSYTWLYENIKSKLIQLETKTSQKIYSLLIRELKIAEQYNLINHIWLIVITKGIGFYLVDQQKLQNLLEAFTKNEIKSGLSNSTIISEFFIQTTDYQEMFAYSAIKSNEKVFSVDFNKAKYYQAKSELVESEKSIYKTSNYCGYIIENNKKIKALFGFSAEYVSVFKPIIERNEKQIKELLNSREKYKFTKYKSENLDYTEKIGVFWGAFTGQFIKTISK